MDTSRQQGPDGLADLKRDNCATRIKEITDRAAIPEFFGRCKRQRSERGAHPNGQKAKSLASHDEISDGIIEEMAILAFAEVRDFYTTGPDGTTVRPSSELPPALRRAVKSITISHTAQGDKIRLRLHNKRGALDILNRLIGQQDRQKRPSPSDILALMNDAQRARRLAEILYGENETGADEGESG